MWFNTLQDVSTKFIDDICGTARVEVVDGEKGDSSDSEVKGDSDSIELHSDEEGSSPEERGDGVPPKRPRIAMDPPPLTRPSDYLRSRCPLCFGGKSPLADGLVIKVVTILAYSFLIVSQSRGYCVHRCSFHPEA